MKKLIAALVLFSSCGPGKETPSPAPAAQAAPPPVAADSPAPAAQESPIVATAEMRFASETLPATDGPFKTKNGRRGWKVTIPGGLALATPACADGKLFIGGGFGSHEFYCLDSRDGRQLWTFKTDDDGPTAAVVDEGYVAFNTESCTVYVLEIATGKKAWSKWLGDPLLSHPAIGSGRLYMAYPGKDGSHHLVCLNLRTGDEIWDRKIAGDIIAAPILHGDSVYLTTFDGTVYRHKTRDGELSWTEKLGATSPPWISGALVLVSQGRNVAGAGGVRTKDENLLGWRDGGGRILDGSRNAAPYLDSKVNGGTGGIAFSREAALSGVHLKSAQSSADAGVGFGGGAPAAAKMDAAESNAGVSNVSGAWAYQGSRPSVAGDRSFAAMGDVIMCHDLKNGQVLWKKSLKPEKAADGLRLFSPPSLANGKLFLASALGDVLSMTAAGALVAIETGNPADDGWPMWGGGPSHNGPRQPPPAD